MKRSLSATPSDMSDEHEATPPPAPPSPSKAKKPKSPKKEPSDRSPSKTADAPSWSWASTPGWTPAKKGALAAKIIAAGIDSLDKGELADEFNLTKSQITSALTRGMKYNLRDQLMRLAGDAK